MEATYYTYQTPKGRITLASNGRAITRLYFGVATFPGVYRATALTNAAAGQILEYLAGKRTSFDVPLEPAGTPFQLRVWRALQDIPYGETRSYGEIAAASGNPKAGRAVGAANNKNPLPLLIPCHRVVGKNGSLVGYAYGLGLKRFLLDLESDAARSGAQSE